MSVRKGLLIASFFHMIFFFRPCLALPQSHIPSELQRRIATLIGSLTANLQSCGERYSFQTKFQSEDTIEPHSQEYAVSQVCKELPSDGSTRESLSRGTPPAIVRLSVPPINDLTGGSHSVAGSRPEELKDIGLEGTTIARVRRAVLGILETENKCSAWFRRSDLDVLATFQSLNFSVDEGGPGIVIKERNDRGAWTEQGPYIARTMQNGGIGATVTINGDGAFFRRKDEIYKISWVGGAEVPTGTWKYLHIGPYDGGTLPAQAIAVLHELAHVINAIPGDDTSHIRSQQNTELVLQYCKSEVSASPNRSRLVMTQSPVN